MDPRAPSAPGQPGHVADPLAGGPDERELIESVLRKDRKAAARFVAAHVDAVDAYARHRLTPQADLVDDVVQDVFLAAVKGLAAFEGQSSLRTWLLAIARHKIEDIYRQRLRAALALDLESKHHGRALSLVSASDTVLLREIQRLLAAALERGDPFRQHRDIPPGRRGAQRSAPAPRPDDPRRYSA